MTTTFCPPPLPRPVAFDSGTSAIRSSPPRSESTTFPSGSTASRVVGDSGSNLVCWLQVYSPLFQESHLCASTVSERTSMRPPPTTVSTSSRWMEALSLVSFSLSLLASHSSIIDPDRLVGTLNGAIINSFYVQCRASPVADLLLCGSSQGCAYVWDLQVCELIHLIITYCHLLVPCVSGAP